MLLFENSCRQRVLVILGKYPYCLLHDDGSVIQFLVDEVHRASTHFHPVGESLLLGLESWKCGQERWMNVKNSVRKLLHEPRGKQPHVPGEADEIDMVFFLAHPRQRDHDPRGRRPFDGITCVTRPSRLAVSIPPASVLFEMTTAMRAFGIVPSVMLRAIASKFEPRPESRMPRFFMSVSSCKAFSLQDSRMWMGFAERRNRLAVHHLAVALHDAAHVVVLLADAFQQGLSLLNFLA